MAAIPALAVEDLSVEFRTRSGIVKVLEHVSFAVDKVRRSRWWRVGLGQVGHRIAVMGILDAAGKVTSGKAMFGRLGPPDAVERELAELRAASCR